MLDAQLSLKVQGVKLIFFSDSHLAPKFFKVVANSRKVGRHFQRQTKPLFYAVIAPVLGAISCPEVAR